MNGENFAIELLGFLKSKNLRFGVFFTSLVMICVRHSLNLPNYIVWLLIVLFFLSIALFIYDIFYFIKCEHKKNKRTEQLKKDFLYKIFTSIKSGYTPTRYKYHDTVMLIFALYYNDFEKFNFNDIWTINRYKELGKSKLIDFVNFVADSSEEALIFIKNGKYEFYNTVWNELDILNNTGLLPFKKGQELPKDTQEALKTNKEAL